MGNDLAVIVLLLGSERFSWWTCYWELNDYCEKNILHVCIQALGLRFEEFLKILGTLTVIEGEEAVRGLKLWNGK